MLLHQLPHIHQTLYVLTTQLYPIHLFKTFHQLQLLLVSKCNFGKCFILFIIKILFKGSKGDVPSSIVPTTSKFTTPYYNSAFIGTNYQIPSVQYYSEPFALTTYPQHSKYHTAHNTISILDANTYPTFAGTIPVESGVHAESDAVVTEVKFQTPHEIISTEQVALPSPAPQTIHTTTTTTAATTTTTTETPSMKTKIRFAITFDNNIQRIPFHFLSATKSIEANESTDTATSFNEIDGYSYKVPQTQLQF